METLEKTLVNRGKIISNTQEKITGGAQQIKRITNTTGVYTGLGLIFYFALMRMLNLHHRIELHYFNIVILFLGLRYAIKNIIKFSGEIKYFDGLKAGVIVSVISIIIFNAFMVIYETLIDPPFLEFLKERINLGDFFSIQFTIINVMWLLTVEGLSSGFILTFILMQYYKAESSETI